MLVKNDMAKKYNKHLGKVFWFGCLFTKALRKAEYSEFCKSTFAKFEKRFILYFPKIQNLSVKIVVCETQNISKGPHNLRF